MNARSCGDSPQVIQVPMRLGCSMLSTTRSAGRKSSTSLMNRSTSAGFLGGDQGVVDPVRADPAHVARPGLGVDRPGLGAGELHVGVELEGVLRGQGDPHPVADLEVLPGAEPAGGDPELLGAALEVGQRVGVLDLVAELDQPDPALLEHQRVVVPLVPALEPELAGLLVHDLHAEGVGVVVAGLFQVGHPQVHVAQPDDGTHLFSSFPWCSATGAAGGRAGDLAEFDAEFGAEFG